MNNNFQELYNYAESINCDAALGEQMSFHTSFKTGGPCGIRLSPKDTEQIILTINKAKELDTPFVILGNVQRRVVTLHIMIDHIEFYHFLQVRHQKIL